MGERASPNPWILPAAGGPEARARLVCFPYAGAGASAYRTWRRALPPHLALALVQLPGREARFNEPLHTSIASLAAGVAGALRAETGPRRPTVFFGHSMGALVAYETARLLAAQGGPAPALLVVSGHRAPHLPSFRAPLGNASDEALLQELGRLGGTPPEVLAHPDLLALVKPIFRADLTACETYRYVPGAGLDCSLVAYGGLADPDAPPASLEGWREHTRGEFTRRLFPGGHFFLQSSERDVLNALLMDVARVAP
ncbi:MAG TPA: alpha/beta fold hydrolase [Candidatus Thermoplasmatota archaeon]|nr:alpha/beta fold hydrolase [Candidatus Thermoplasmatota archaeon]